VRVLVMARVAGSLLMGGTAYAGARQPGGDAVVTVSK